MTYNYNYKSLCAKPLLKGKIHSTRHRILKNYDESITENHHHPHNFCMKTIYTIGCLAQFSVIKNINNFPRYFISFWPMMSRFTIRLPKRSKQMLNIKLMRASHQFVSVWANNNGLYVWLSHCLCTVIPVIR